MAASGGTITWGATEITVAVGETKTVTYESTFSSPDPTYSAWSEARNYASITNTNTDAYHGIVSFTGNAVGEATISAGATVGYETTTTNQLKITVVDPTQVIVAENSLQDIADAIRGKLGVATTYKPADMASAIASISGGGGGGIDLSGFYSISKGATGSFTGSANSTQTITHNLGATPKIIIFATDDAIVNWRLTNIKVGIYVNINSDSSTLGHMFISESDLINASIATTASNLTTTQATLQGGTNGKFINGATYTWVALA